MKLIDKLPEDAVQIKNALTWVDPRGVFYGIETRTLVNSRTNKKLKHKNYGKFFIYNCFKNQYNGYVYISVKYIIDKERKIYKSKQRRAHIVIAEVFLENPENLPVVGHKNNIKNDNRIENLYWTTWKENSQKAHDDGLIINDKGYEDSQSKPVFMFDTYTNKKIGEYGSISEASRISGIAKNTILRQSKYKKPVRKPFYFRFQDDPSVKPPTIVVEYDFKTHREVNRYINIADASRKTGISSKTINQQCINNSIPKWIKGNTYFLYKKENI